MAGAFDPTVFDDGPEIGCTHEKSDSPEGVQRLETGSSSSGDCLACCWHRSSPVPRAFLANKTVGWLLAEDLGTGCSLTPQMQGLYSFGIVSGI